MIIHINDKIMTISIERGGFGSDVDYDRFNRGLVTASYTRAFFLLNRFFPSVMKGVFAETNIHDDIHRLIVKIEAGEEAFLITLNNPAIPSQERGASVAYSKKVVTKEGRCQSIW